MNIYTWYTCKGCNKEVILLSDEVQHTVSSGQYLSCPHCGCRHLIKGGITDDLRECMKERRYRRNSHGALEQW